MLPYLHSLTSWWVLTTDCNSVRLFRAVGGSLINCDNGICYNTLAVSAFCLRERSPGNQRDDLTSEALFYHIKGLSSINSRLGDPLQRKTDCLLISIMAMAVHALTYSAPLSWCWESTQPIQQKNESVDDQWRLHLQAVNTILEDRGGIESIDSNSSMRHWLYL